MTLEKYFFGVNKYFAKNFKTKTPYAFSKNWFGSMTLHPQTILGVYFFPNTAILFSDPLVASW
jgi:hypothetical protein